MKGAIMRLPGCITMLWDCILGAATFRTTARTISCALATASAVPVMRTTHGSLLLSTSTLAPLVVWISLMCLPPGPMRRPVQLSGTSMDAAASVRLVRSRPSRTSVTIVLATSMDSGVPLNLTVGGSVDRSTSILQALFSCSSVMRAPPAPMRRPTAFRGSCMKKPGVACPCPTAGAAEGGSMMAAMSLFAFSTDSRGPMTRTRQKSPDLSTST
mmetsp:Transcript_4856/g.12983  ORF Transcript_4856/g.12983 Transcript_4856/m.12983 type:complete len:214 (+) Transcript_4856:356-997(+)